jgi:NAD(P)-dependent dehydrogenase (short-subunit alcohol dehydrogenase family)
MVALITQYGEEIAQTIVFLASDKVDYITGHIIGVNGGKTASRPSAFSIA